MTEKLRVTSLSYAKSPAKRTWRMPTLLRLIGMRNFFWVLALIGIAGFLHLRGTPHVLFEYSYLGPKDHMTDCTYLGLHTQTVSAIHGKCPIIRFLK